MNLVDIASKIEGLLPDGLMVLNCADRGDAGLFVSICEEKPVVLSDGSVFQSSAIIPAVSDFSFEHYVKSFGNAHKQALPDAISNNYLWVKNAGGFSEFSLARHRAMTEGQNA